MCVEAGTGLGSRTRQISMTDNLGIGKHLMKDGFAWHEIRRML